MDLKGGTFPTAVSADASMLDALLEGVAIVDSARSIMFLNESACRMLGAGRDELIGRPYDLVLFGTDRSADEADLAGCPINFCLTEGAPAHMPDAVFLRGDRSTFFAEFVCTPISDGRDATAVLLSFRDVTLRRDIEKAFADARDAALEAARAKAAFLANISHEIRTPLSGIVGTANLLADTELDPEQSDYVEMLKQSIGSLLETVNDILDFSKIEAGKLRLDPVDFDLRKLVNDTLTVFRSGAEAKSLSLDAVVGDGVGSVFRGDAGRIRQVLGNLISNAIKFTPSGGVKLSVEQTGPDRDVIRFEVADSGIGIAESQRSRLFQPFAQGDVSTTRRFGGTGLGLAISREIVEMMGGEIGVETEPRHGSTFWFTVRLTPGGGGVSVETDAWESLPGELRVLVAEDNGISSEIIRKLLETFGCRVRVAANGEEAVRIACSQRFDLILMDCQMPLVDGFAATRTVREGPGPNRSTKIIALSAHAVEIERDNCLRAGMDDFLCKPLTRESLGAMLEKHFPRSPDTPNLDLNPNLIQHFLSKHVAPDVLDGFASIEARGEPNFVSEIFHTFFRFSEAELKSIGSDIDRNDLEAVRRRAHALKGSSANVGLARIASICGRLEKAVESGDRVAETAGDLRREIDELKRGFDLNYECREKESRLRAS